MAILVNKNLTVKENILALIRETNPRFVDVTANMFTLVSNTDGTMFTTYPAILTVSNGRQDLLTRDSFTIQGIPTEGLSADQITFQYRKCSLLDLQVVELVGAVQDTSALVLDTIIHGINKEILLTDTEEKKKLFVKFCEFLKLKKECLYISNLTKNNLTQVYTMVVKPTTPEVSPTMLYNADDFRHENTGHYLYRDTLNIYFK